MLKTWLQLVQKVHVDKSNHIVIGGAEQTVEIASIDLKAEFAKIHQRINELEEKLEEIEWRPPGMGGIHYEAAKQSFENTQKS